MTRSVYAAQIADLEDAMVRCPEYRRALVLQQVTKLFLDVQRETIGRLDHLDDVLVCLMRPATASDLSNVSNALVRSGLRLPNAIRHLARHREASVAVPVLRHSNLVSEDDLADVAETRDLEHLLAIGSRTRLSEYITTTLIMRGYSAVHTLIARNSSAQISEAGFSVLLKIAERDAELAGSLGPRSDIPHGVRRKFLAMVAEKPKAAFLRDAPASVKAIAESETPKTPKAAILVRDYSSAEKEIAELRRAGKLNDSTINRFAVMQEIDKLTVALAVASDTPVRSIEWLLSNSSEVDKLVMACKASRIRWATAVSILKARESCAPLEGHELKVLSGLFDSLSLSEAQRTVRFGLSSKR
jgi:uncharacterized protein (DUF2336 family)